MPAAPQASLIYLVWSKREGDSDPDFLSSPFCTQVPGSTVGSSLWQEGLKEGNSAPQATFVKEKLHLLKERRKEGTSKEGSPLGWETIPAKGQILNMSAFVGYLISVTTIPTCFVA